MFSRCFRRQQCAKSKHIFEKVVQVVQVVPALWRVHLVQVVEGAGPDGVPALVLLSCVPLLCPLSRFVFGALPLKYAFIRVLRGFLEGFPCWMYVCIACVLCVACGAFVCVRCLAV